MKLSTKLVKIKKGINFKFLLRIKYHNITRIVEPHILGYSYDNEPILRVFEQLRDDVDSNEFKTYLLSSIQSISVSNIAFDRTVTKPTDEAMKKIILTTYTNGKTQEEV